MVSNGIALLETHVSLIKDILLKNHSGVSSQSVMLPRDVLILLFCVELCEQV